MEWVDPLGFISASGSMLQELHTVMRNLGFKVSYEDRPTSNGWGNSVTNWSNSGGQRVWASPGLPSGYD